jgi:general secretion pathway protein D
VPYISAIPVLGELFKHKKHERQRRSLIVFITPTVVHSSADQKTIIEREAARRKQHVRDELNEILGIPKEEKKK